MNSMFGGMKLNGDEVGGPVEMDGRGSEWGTRGAFADEREPKESDRRGRNRSQRLHLRGSDSEDDEKTRIARKVKG